MKLSSDIRKTENFCLEHFLEDGKIKSSIDSYQYGEEQNYELNGSDVKKIWQPNQ